MDRLRFAKNEETKKEGNSSIDSVGSQCTKYIEMLDDL